MKIVVDAMGGDNAPREIVKGAVDAINHSNNFDVILIGAQDLVNNELAKYSYDSNRVTVIDATEKITGDDEPVKAIKRKKDSSLVKAFNMIKSGEADVLVSAGNSGALLSGCILILSRIKGVDRPALAAIIPSKGGKFFLLLDAGANTSCKAETLMNFAVMGKIYMEDVFDMENPRIGLLNVGIEEQKGNEAYKQAHQLLKNSDLNFVGNIEGSEVVSGKADVIVCDGFTGNVLLKFYEGLGKLMLGNIKKMFMKSIFTKLSALVLKKGINEMRNDFDAAEHGGAPFLGVNGKVVKSHGNSKSKDIMMTILKAKKYGESDIIEKIKTSKYNKNNIIDKIKNYVDKTGGNIGE